VLIASPDKDLAQCVRGSQVVCFDRMRRHLLDEPGVVEKFGVRPASIPDWLALVGDSADGIPGIPRWGKRSASLVLARYRHLEEIPDDACEWDIAVRGARGLAASLKQRRDEARLFRELTTLRSDVPLREELAELRWRGARRASLEELCRELGDRIEALRVPIWQH
jgi:5'-3' exonuclease